MRNDKFTISIEILPKCLPMCPERIKMKFVSALFSVFKSCDKVRFSRIIAKRNTRYCYFFTLRTNPILADICIQSTCFFRLGLVGIDDERFFFRRKNVLPTYSRVNAVTGKSNVNTRLVPNAVCSLSELFLNGIYTT
jgi:hypothetical protein